MKELEKIVVGTARGSEGGEAVDAAIALARASGAAVELVDAALPRGPGARCVVRNGEPSAEILGEAAARRADLIVAGTHGRVGLDRLLLGSVAAYVVREAPCNVLVVPAAALAAPEEVAEEAEWIPVPAAVPAAVPPLPF